MAERQLYTLYKNLKAQNYDVPDDYNKFESALTRDGKSGADNRHAIYENLKAQNFDVPSTYERFYSALFVPRSRTSSRAKGGSVPMSAADRARFSAGAAAISASAKQIVNNAGRYNRLKQRKQKQQKDFGRVNLGTHLTPFGGDANNVVKDEFAYNPKTGKAGAYVTSDNENAYTQSDAEQKQAILDQQDAAYQQAVDTGEIPSVFDVRDKNGNYDLQENINKNGTYLTEEGAQKQFDKKLADAYARKKEIEALIAEDNRQHGNPLLSYGASIGASNGRTAEQSDYRNKLVTSLSLVTEQIGALEAVKQYPTSSWGEDALKALDNTVFTAKTWDFGLTDFATMGQMERIKTKMDNNLPLSGSDKMLLKSKLGADAAAALEDEKMGNVYRWTKIAGQSLPFMTDFFLTGGYGGITKGISRGALKFAAKRGMGKVSAAILKNTGIVAGDVVGSYAMAGTEQALKTGADIMQRHLGNLYQDEKGDYKFGTFDENGNLLHEGGESIGTALYKGLTSAMVENYTEKLFGHNYGIKKGAIAAMEKHGMDGTAQFFKNIGKSGWYTNSKKWMEKFGINGFGEEVMEEEIGIPLHALLDGDNNFSDLGDAKQQLDIIGGMAISVGSMYAMGAGSRPVKGIYNRAQYYRFRNKVNVADNDAQSLLGDNWADIKDKIDNATNEQMGGVLADILRQRDTMNKEQINAAVSYGVNLMKMRGYNIAKTAEMNAREITNEPTTPEEQHQTDIDNAYSEGYDADDADKHDIQLKQEDQMKTLAAALGISEQQLSAMSDEELESLTGQDDKLDQAIYDYQLSSARYQGVVDDAQDKVDLAAHQAEQKVDMYTDRSRGSVRNATIKASGGAEDYGVYIISGNIATHEDGSIDVSNSDDMILYYDPTKNSVEHADALMFAELGEELPADDVKAQAVADAKENAIKETAGIIDGTVEVGSQFNVTDTDGTEHTYEVLADYGDGTAAISIDGNVVENPYSFADLQQMKDLEDQKRLEAAKAEREQMEKERSAQQNQETEQTQPSFDFNQILNDDGNVVIVDVLDKDGNTKYPDSKLFLIRDSGAKAKVVELKSDGTLVPHAVNKEDVATISSMSLDEYKQAMPESSMIEDNSGENRGEIEVEAPTIEGETDAPAEETAAPESAETPATEQTPAAPAITLEDGTIVPMLEDGNPDFSKLTAAQTAELYDTEFGEDADSIVSGYVSDAKKALDKANNMTVKGKTFVEQKAAKDAKEKAIADAQAAYDSAIAIRDAYNERQLAKVEDTAEGRKNLIEKARRKFARLKSAVKDDAEAVSQLYRDTVGSLMHRLYDSTGIDVTDTNPLTAEEYVASNLGAHSLNYEGTKTSKGVKQETGLSREDFAKTQLLAADGKGTTVDALVHSLWENRPSNLDTLGTQDIRNALIDVLTSGFKASEARSYIENIRIAQAEKLIEEEGTAAENAAYYEQQKAKEEEEKKKAELEKKAEGEKKKSEEEKTEDNENTEFPDKLQEGSKAIEAPEDATDEKPLGEQLDETDLPFSAKENGKQQATSERAADVEKNKVDDMKVVDNIVGQKTRKAFERLAKMMGANIQWQYSDKLGNGWIQETKDADGNVHRTIFITLDSSITEGAQFIFGHEMTHQIKNLNPAAYNELTQIVLDTYGSEAFDKAVDETMKRYSDAGFSGRARDYYAEEVVADAVGKMIRDLNLAHTLAMKMSHPLLAAIHEILQKIKLAFFGTEYSDVTKNIIRSIEQAYVKTSKGEVTNSETGEDVSYSLRQKPEPKKKGVGYKVFVLKDGKLYPPMVANPDGAATPVGVWLDADAAPIAGESKTGRPQVKQGGKGTQGGSGKLAYRPGWHLGVVPYAIQFNRKDAEGNKTLFPKNFVFAEVEYAADVDYQEEARQEGINPSGKYQHSLAGLKHLPTDGYYMYRTNPNPETDPWVITGAMKVNRILTRAEQAELVKNAGREPQQIQEGDIVTDDVVNSINQEIADAPKFSLKVYHGSGADFTEFDFDHMGEGAGSQVFGWGGYVTSSKKIGKDYASIKYDPDKDVEYVGKNKKTFTDLIATLFDGGIRDYNYVKNTLLEISDNDKSNISKKEEYDWFVSTKPEDWFNPNQTTNRNLYEVNIPEDNGSNYLEWEKKPSDEVATKIIEGLYGLDAKTLDDMASKDIVFRTLLYDYIKNADKEQMIPLLVKTHALTRGTTYDNGNVEDDIRFVYNRLSRWMGSQKAASQFLSSLGFTGIKYPAGTIMGGAEEGDTNYVIFKPENMKIIEHTKFSLRLKSAIEETETNPSDAQKEIGNYKKGHIKFGGYDYTIENPKGSTRSGKDANGKEWKVTMHDTYGYIRGKFGKDGDHLDMFINDKADLDNWNGDVFVVDQVNPDGSFDEHKVMYGYDSMNDAEKAYLANYSKGWKGLGNIIGASKTEFDKWLDTSNRKLKPFADYAKVKFSQAQSVSEPRYSLKDIKPVGVGSFGNIYNQFRGNAKAAIEFLKKVRGGEAVGALHHKDIGDIDLVWGKEGTGHSDGYGLSKLVKYHPEVLDNLQEILNDMRVVSSSKNRVNLESETHKAGVRLTWDGERKSWLLTAFKKETSASDKRTDTAATSLEGDTALSQTEGSAAKIDNSSETTKENGEKFSLKDEKTLAGVHNITEEKLRKALKLGGFANPSLAVIDTSKSGHDNFGEISFIAPSALVDKRTGKTAGTWITDAYTQRYPSVEREMSEKGYRKFEDWVDSLDYPSGAKAEIERQAKDALSDNNAPAWELMYLKEKGIDIKEYDSRIDYRWKEIISDHPTAEDILNSMKTDPELNEKVTSLAKHAIIHPTWEKVSLEVRRKMYKETGVKASPINPQVRKQTKEIFERDYAPTLLNKDGSPRKKDVKKVVEDIVKEHNDTKQYDFYLSKVKASNYVNKNGLYDDYIRWQENKLDEFGTKNRIFRGYTRDGSRKYVPETLENVSKAMREEADGQTNGSEYTSFGSFIAKLASRVDSTDEMRANKDKLSSNKDKEEFYEKWSEVYYDLAKFLYNDVFYGEQRLHDIVLQSDPKKYAKKEYGITLTPTFMKKLDALKNAVQTELKSAYFETKYNRPLRLNEFAAAVVPDNLGEDVRKGIENAGLPMYDYDPNKEGDRSRAFNEAVNSSDNIRFSLKEEKEKIVADAKANGTYMTAPNGEKTKLDAEQWATVRTTNFKNWFGDWENDPENASKVVDENGEPMVVWHGRSTEFNTFEKKEGVRFIMGLEDKVKAEGFFFSPDKGLAEEFASNSSRHRGGKANVVPCFLNIRRPMDLTGEDYDRIYEDVTGWEYMVGMDTQDNLWGIMDEEGMADKIKEKGYDGAIFVEEVDDSYEPTKISYCALDANQIKSAENNNGDFSADNNDIRFSLAGERGAAAADKAEERTTRMDFLSVARKMEEEKKDAKAIKMATGWERGADGKWRYEMPDAKIKDTMNVGGGHIVKRYEDDMLWNGGKLSEVIDAPELFKAYPQLKDVLIETDAIMNDMPSNGEYNSNTNTITIHADELKYMNGILNHEIQHAIQDIEGFAKGGSPRLVRGEVKKRFDEVTKQIKQLRAEGKEDEAKALVEKNRGLYNAYTKNDDFNSYKSLAGEVEARNVQERMNMTSEERRKTLAESTEDVARKDQIFLGVGDVSFSLRDMADGKESGAADIAEDLKSLNTPDEVDDAIKTAIDDMPSGWKMANKKMIHIAQALGENRKAEIAGEEPKFSLKDGTLIKAGTYFSGGGLVEEGLKGIIDPVVAVEYDEKISGVYRNNFGQHIVTADVRDVDPKELVKQIDGEVEYFHASPVCKNYSQAKSNHAEVELDKETAASTAEFINAIKPKVVTIENVKGYKDSDAMKTITDALDANGYTWDADVYNAADYGGYTNRERLIVRAIRDGKLPAKPEKMARKSGWYEAVADIIPTLTEKKNGVAPWMDIRLKADGIDWRHIDKPLYVMGSAYADGKVPHAFADELLPTLRTKSGDVIVMPDGKVYRAMGRVLARVSGVSDDYKMPFSENLSHTIIGNGIPTQLTEHVIAPLLQNTLRPTIPEDGNTKFSLRYDQFEHDLNQWKKDNNLPKDAQRPTIPQRNAGESAVDFLKRVDEYRKQMALWKTAPTYEQHLLSDDTALGEFNRELQRGSVLKRIAFQDSMLAIRKAQEAIMKEVGVDRLNMAEDAYTAENRSHGKGKNEFEEYNNEFLQPLRKAYHQMKKVLGDSYDNVRIYMMAKHGLERDAQMAFKKSLEADYEDVAQRSAAYKAYKGDMNRIINDSDLEFGRVDFTTWRQRDNALRVKYSPSYMNYRYDKMGIAYDYSGLSALFDGSDFEEAAHKLIKDIESKYVTETHDLWDATNAATKKILRDGYKAGMMSKDTYQYVRDMYSHYIPLRGWDGTTADQVWDYIGGGKGAFNQTLKKANGRTSIADDPIAYIENMAESGILLNNKNWVKQHLMLLAQNHPTSLLTLSKAWYVKSVDDNGNEEWIPATPQITSQMDSNQVKAAIDAFEKKMEKMAQTGDATQKRDGLNIAYPQTHSEEREHEVRVMKDGEEYVIYVNGDPQLAQAMNNTRAHRVREIQSGKLDRAAAWLGRKMAAAYTSLSPLFIPSNYFRDLTMTLASTAIREDGRYNYLLRKNLATSWNLGFMLKDYQNGKLREKVSNGNATPKEQMFYDFMMNGGETGFVSSLDVEDLKKKFKNDLKDLDRWKANPVKVGHTVMDGIEFLNRMIEDSNRFAIYMTSIQYGRSIDEAVNDAKDVTLNFNRKGTGEYGWQMIRNLYLFINPAVQSLQTLGALVKHHPFKFTAVTASWLASGVLVPIVNAALMSLLGGDDDKDKYWQFTKWDRRNNLIMWVPFTHEYVKIPLAQEFRAFYGVGDMIASKMMGGELAEESWSQYAEDLLGQVVDMLPLDPTGYDGNIAVSLMPNAIRPVFELAFNVDFTGKPLFKDTEYNKYDPNFTKAYVGTPDWLVRASRMMNSIGNDYPDVQQNKWDALGDPRYNLNNPAVVDHVLSSYLGGAYTMGSQVLGVLTKSLNDPKEIKVADIPLFSKFVSNPDDRPVTKKQGDEFWNMKENHDRAANTLSKLKKQAKVDGDYSMLERFYGSEEYKQYKKDDVKVKKYEEDKKKERAEESGEEYRPHKLNAEDIYKAHATPKDDFEDLKLKQLYTKLNGFKSAYDLLVDTAPSQSDGYYNTNKAAIDAIDEISLDKQEISELKKGFLDDGKDAYNAEDMKQIRELRKKILAVLEKANKVVVANQKEKAKKK